MDNKHGYQYRGMESILRHMARRDQSYLSLWLQWTLARPNSAFRDEVVAANHASVPFKVLEALAREMLENAATEDTLENQIARTLLEVLRLVALGLSNREIGERLFLALSTVKGYNRIIFDKLQVQRRTEAIARARQLGLL